jgi:DUF4097 and DUF4098 domain-containing protein YvlB
LKSKLTFMILFLFCLSIAFSFERTDRFSLPADGINKLMIDCGSGFLRVTGEDSLKAIEVEAEIIVRGKSDRDMEEYVADNVRLELKRQGDRAVLVSGFKNSIRGISFREKVINLTVRTPKYMDMEVDDGSGEIDIAQINGNIRIDDGSGTITIRGIRGDVEIDDGSGTIEVSDVTGNVMVDDGSGTIDLTNVEKDVEVTDGSGSIYIDTVGGDVIIKDDGSGGLRIRNVKGRVVK